MSGTILSNYTNIAQSKKQLIGSNLLIKQLNNKIAKIRPKLKQSEVRSYFNLLNVLIEIN